jgi:hypothetical protein
MVVPIQVTFDCADPDRLAHFWAELLGYRLDPPPEGHDSWDTWLIEQGIPESEWNSASAVSDPEDRGPRLSSSSAFPSRRRSRTEFIST